jgi:hypothetical protein
MIIWFFTNYAMQLVYLCVGAWLLNGLRKALFKPRLKILSVSDTGAGTFVEVERQQLLPPWLTFKETWVQESGDFTREIDGVELSADRFGPTYLNKQLARLLRAYKMRQKETDELLRQERPRAQA